MGKRKKGRPRSRNGLRARTSAADTTIPITPDRISPPPTTAKIADAEPADNGEPGPVEPGSGILELHPNGYGFLRNPEQQLHRGK